MIIRGGDMLYPKAFTDTIKRAYTKYTGSFRAKRIDYHHDEVLYVKGNLGAGKTAGALAYCDLYPNTLYFSFKHWTQCLRLVYSLRITRTSFDLAKRGRTSSISYMTTA